jgi:DNA processing protein
MVDEANYGSTAQVLALVHFCDVTPRLFEVLLRRFRTLDAVFGVDRTSFLEIDGLPQRQAERLARASKRLPEAEAMVHMLSARDIHLLTRFDDAYGQLLFELHDPPTLLYVRGRGVDPSQKSIAVVGTSSATIEGIEVTTRLVKELVRHNVQIVSSLRRGIDTAVHLAARSAEGRSFAVIDCGLDKVEPTEGMPVAVDIVQSGGVISEYAPDVVTGPKSLAEANRLIVGLAQAVVVTEVYAQSERTLDLLRACRDIGKLAFLMIDPKYGALTDAASLVIAHECGAVPIEGLDKINDIVKSLV